MGGNWYSRARDGMFEVPKPLSTKGIGVDSLPESIRTSSVLSGNDLGMLGNVEALPTKEEALSFIDLHPEIKNLGTLQELHTKAKEFLMNNEVSSAWKVLMIKQ